MRVPLAKHEIKQDVHPIIRLTCGSAKLEMKFTVELTAEVECVDLIISDGCLSAVQAGRLTPSASLLFKDIKLGEKNWDAVEVPLTHRLQKGGWRIVNREPR